MCAICLLYGSYFANLCINIGSRIEEELSFRKNIRSVEECNSDVETMN